MPSASEHEKSPFVKILFVGNSGAGKTGALAALVQAGYKLRIYDFDNGLEALFHHVKEIDPKLLDNIQYAQFRDKVKMTAAGSKVVGVPKAYPNCMAALESWPDDGSDPAELGEDYVVVVDALTNVGRAAFKWATAANPSSKDPRQWYKAAQDLVEDMIANLTSEEFRCHVIVISHVDVGETTDGRIKAFVSAIGKALGPKLPRFFNTMLLSETSGAGKTVKRTIKTVPTNLLDLKNPAPHKIKETYPMETGLLDIFRALGGKK